MSRQKYREICPRFLRFADIFQERCRELLGEDAGPTRLYTFLGCSKQAALKWHCGNRIPPRKWWKAIGIFMGWMEDADDEAGWQRTEKYFMSDEPRTTKEELEGWYLLHGKRTDPYTEDAEGVARKGKTRGRSRKVYPETGCKVRLPEGFVRDH